MTPTTEEQILNSDTLCPDGFGGFGNQFPCFICGLFLWHISGYERMSLLPFVSISHLSLLMALKSKLDNDSRLNICARGGELTEKETQF
jgi:hypothetical protein